MLQELLLAVALLAGMAGMAGRQDPPPELPAAAASTAQERQSGDPQASGAEAAPSDSPEPRPIPEGEVLARAEVVSGTLRRVEARIEPEPAVERIAEQLGRTELDILLARGELESLTLERVTARRLEDLRLPWLELVADLAGWKARVEERFEELQDKRESLRAEREAWELTRARAADQELSDELLGAVDATLERLVEIESRARERRDQVGSILQRVVTSDELAIDAIDKLDELDGLLRKRRLRRGAPLWQAFAAETPGSPAPGPLRGSGKWTEALVD